MDCLVLVVLNVRELFFTSYEAAGAGSGEDGGAVTLEVGPRPLQHRDGRVQPCELLLDGRDDAVLFGERGEWKRESRDDRLVDVLLRTTFAEVVEITSASSEVRKEVFGNYWVMVSKGNSLIRRQSFPDYAQLTDGTVHSHQDESGFDPPRRTVLQSLLGDAVGGLVNQPVRKISDHQPRNRTAVVVSNVALGGAPASPSKRIS
ncbi:MAG: hypothetical protein M3R02_12820 [Chloroflexota bacterium]|nr:hypothetical protein [Chloroflexota bacterium]